MIIMIPTNSSMLLMLFVAIVLLADSTQAQEGELEQQLEHSFLRALQTTRIQQCSARGGYCDTDANCCGTDLCKGHACIQRPVCSASGGYCDYDADCCGYTSASTSTGLFCIGQACIQECSARGGYCDYDSDCCGSDLCSGLTCRQGSDLCQAQYGSCARTDDCCEPWHCVSNKCDQGVSSCTELGGICYQDGECCGNTNCWNGYCTNSGSTNSCAELWDVCTATSECCDSMHCREFTCGRADCGVKGQTCRDSIDCCAGNSCLSGICDDVGGGGSSSSCQGLDSSCSSSDDCCGDYVCSSTRWCSRQSHGGPCSTEVGAQCGDDTDCCAGPNFICDRSGAYCRYS